ncbi:MAG: DUF1559 domain-containing protein [Planctomycetota bacterium]
MPDNPYRSPDAAGGKPAAGTHTTDAPTPFWTTSRVVEWLVAFGVIAVLVALMLPAVRTPREVSRRHMCANNLKQIALAMHNYHDQHGAFPPAYTVDAEGNRLHSWRTLILPYIEEQALYEAIDLTKPWDDPANASARETVIECYQCPSADVEGPVSTYIAVVGPDGVFPGATPTTFADCTDGASRTIIVVEVTDENAVEWMSPNDASLQSLVDRIGREPFSHHPGGFQAAWADGHVSFISDDLEPSTFKSLLTRSGGEVIDPDGY